MKKALSLLLTCILFFSNAARCEVPSFANQNFSSIQDQLRYYSYNYGRINTSVTIRGRRIAEKVRATEKAAAAKSSIAESAVQNLGHQGQALVLILIISGIEIVHQQIKMAKLKKQELNYSELTELAGKAADQILLGGSVYSSMIGAGTIAGVSYKPIQVINQFIGNQNTKPIFKSLLQSGIVSFITFTGWEMGGQLWSEAKELIENEADYARAERLGPVLLGSLQSLVSTNQDFQDDLRVLKVVFGNMARILVADNDLRNLWLYNTWRMRIATGGFLAIVTAMVSAGVVGTTLFPGAGTLGGMCFGIVGGTLALFVPEQIKDGVTDSVASARSYFGSRRAETMQLELREIYRQDNNSVFAALGDPMQRVAQAKDFLSRMQAYREDAVTAEFEILYRNYSKLNVLRGNKKVALAANNTQAIPDIENKLKDVTSAIRGNIRALENFYKNESEKLNNLIPKPKSQELATLLLEQNNKLLILSGIISSLLSGLFENTNDSSSATSSAILLNKIYFMGFKEAYLGI
jgi:hypothetical protein